MPYCEVGKYQNTAEAAGNNGIKIFYETYGHGPVKVLLIIGNFRLLLYFLYIFQMGFCLILMGRC